MSDKPTYEELEKRVRGLEKAESELKQAEDALRERNKELRCLQQVRDALDEDLSIDDLCQRIVESLAQGVQFPEVALPVITLGDKSYGFETPVRPSIDGLHANIEVGGETVGSLSVFYREGKSFILPEEQNLIEAASKILSHHLERAYAHKELRGREERLQLALNGADLGTWDWNVQSGHVTFDERWAEMLGYRLDEIEPHVNTWEKLVHPDDVAEVMEALNAHLEGKTAYYEREHRARHKSGEWIWILDKGRVIERDAQGLPLRICGTHLDITERKQAEAEAAEHHLLTKEINVLAIELASLMEEVDIQDFVVDRLMRTPGARISWFSEYDPEQRVLNLQRIKAEPGLLDKVIKLLGSRIEGYKTPVSEDIYQEIVKSTVGKIKTLNDLTFGMIPQSVGSAIQSITGVDRFIGLAHVIEGKLFGISVLAMGANEPDPPTELLNTIAHLVAISLRRRTAEKALRESEQRYRTILKSIADGYYEVDLAGNLTFFNDSVCELLGYSRDELMGMNNRQYTDTRNAAELLTIFNEVYRTRKPKKGFGWEVIRKDQTRRFVEASVTLMKDTQGKPSGFRGIVRDITDRELAEEQIRHRLIYEQMLSRISTMAVQHEDLERFLGDSLAIMGETLDVSRVYLFEHHHETDSMDNTVEWCAPEQSPQKETLQGLPSAAFPWWMATLKEGGTIRFSDIEDIPEEGAKEILRPQGICSILVVPLFVASRYQGFIGFDECRFHREWPEKDVEILLAISRIISGAMYKKQSEEEIERERQQLLSIFNSIEESIYISDPETYEVLYVNRKLANALQRDCVGGVCYKEFQGFDEPCSFCTNDIILKHKPQPHYWEYYNPKIEKQFSLVDRIIEWPDGRNVRFEMATDITERKQAEEALKAAEETYRNIFLNSQVGLFRTDVGTGMLLDANDAVARFFGYKDREELLAEPFNLVERYVDPEDRKRMLSLLEACGEFRDFEAYFRKKDGSHVLHRYSGRIVPDKGWIEGVSEDITERKRTEEEKEKLQAQLAQAQKMESIGNLAGGIAHNFNNILMGIQGRASLMMMDKSPSHADYEHLRGIEEYIKNAVELTKDLLGFARGGKYEVKAIDLNALIKHENRMFGRTKKEIQVQGKYEKNLWAVEVDPSQMRQALLNLYVNAWQAMPGGGTLYVQTENVNLDQEDVKPFAMNPGRYVKVSVTDTGVGMDDNTRDKIFDPFFSTKDGKHGTGLGLASVYGIIKNHGGYINVYSEKGTGTTFNIYLPASEEEAVEKGPIPDREEIHYGKGTVLLVDDEEMILEVGRMMLEKLGYQVLVARSGPEALDVYGKQKEEIELVILDMIMPGMGGGETYDRLKEVDGDVRVLLSSGYSINGQAREIMDRGCMGFIQKPFAMDELSRIVKEVFDR